MVATQFGYFDTSMPHTGHKSFAPGFGGFAAPCPHAASGGKENNSRNRISARRFMASSTLLLHHHLLAALRAVLAYLRDVFRHAEVGLLHRLVEIAQGTAVFCLQLLRGIG